MARVKAHIPLPKTLRAAATFLILAAAIGLAAQDADAPTVTVKWDHKTADHSVPTLQAVVNPLLRRGSPIHDAAFDSLRSLGCDYVRYAFWLPYPRLAVAELRPPDQSQTYWDFRLIDPLVQDFYSASEGHPSVWMFSTIPQWMFTTPHPVTYPDDPDGLHPGH